MNVVVCTPQNGIQYVVRFAFCYSILLHLSVFSRKSMWLISPISVCGNCKVLVFSVGGFL
jgi:hypothetical protein